jgi:hypothetical protein
MSIFDRTHDAGLYQPPIPGQRARQGLIGATNNFMRNSMGRIGNRWADWGLKGVRESFTEGAGSAFGFYKAEAGGKLKFMGGVSKRSMLGLGIGAGVGAAVYAATDNPLLGLGAGVGAVMASKSSLKGVFGAGLKALGPLFIGTGVAKGYREGGFGGAIKALGVGTLEWGLWNVGFKALSVAFQGAGSAALAVALPLGIVGAAGFGAFKGAQYFAGRGRRAVESEFAGDTTAFNTEAAYSMRQRAVQEISRSHTNSRTILGQEAQLMHLR